MQSHAPGASLDLAKCFTGEEQLISWEVAYTALCDPPTASKSRALRSFLTAASSIDTLSRPWRPFGAASPQHKSKMDTATAPIHVTSPPNPHYNMEEIKADSAWLSQQTHMSEYAALRLAMLEWQSRPAVQLLGGLTEEEVLSVHEAAGMATLGASTFVANSSILAAPSAFAVQADAQFNAPEQRKLRLIGIYHAERIAILRISQLLLCWGAAKDLRSAYGPDYRVCDVWLEQLGQHVASRQQQPDPASPGASFLDQCIQTVNTISDGLENGFTWAVPESVLEPAAEKWATAQITETIHVLHLALIHADLFTKKLVSAPTVEEWFTTMANRAYFLGYTAVFPTLEPLISLLHLLASMLSLAILKVQVVLDDLQSGQYASWDRSSYVLDSALVEHITMAFGHAKQLGPSPATAPAFAWAVITWRLTAQATALEHERELGIENGSAGPSTSSSPLEEAVLALTKLEGQDLFNRRIPSQDLAEVCSDHRVLELIAQMVNTAMSAFGTSIDRISRDRIRLLCLQPIRAGLASEIIAYSDELVHSALTILAGEKSGRRWFDQDPGNHTDPVTSYFLADKDVLRFAVLDEAQYRFPYETMPLLKICSALTRGENATQDGMPTAASMLANANSLMQRLPDNFSGYSSIREEENANYVALTEDLPQFASRPASGFRGPQRKLLMSAGVRSPPGSMIIPPGTVGRIVDDSASPFVAAWQYPHSALDYLVRLLSTYMVGNNQVEFATQAPINLSTAADTVGFFADLLHSSLRASAGKDVDPACSSEVLDALGVGLDRTQDTVSIVLAIFEEQLLRQCEEPSNVESLELLVNCTHFLNALIAIAPSRVWPWLARSCLLETDGNGGSFATILIGTEMVLGRYDFLIGCIQLFHALVRDAVTQVVSRKAPASQALTRLNAGHPTDSGTSDKIMSNVLLAFGKMLASVYEGSLSWRYNRIEDRLEINIRICDAFKTVLEYAYGIDDAPKLSTKLTGLIAPVAEYIANLFLSNSENDMPTNPILSSLLAGTGSQPGSIQGDTTALWKQQTQAALSFSDLLVRVAMLLGKPWTHLEQQLYKATPLLARLYAASDAFKTPVVTLLDSLVRGATRVGGEASSVANGNEEKREPPSLLGHLGPKTAKNFLSILSGLDEPLQIVDVQTNVWHFLSSVVTCKQQWLALYLLTGNTPRESMKSKASPGSESFRNKALLTRALEALSKLNLNEPDRPWPLFTSMLEFVCAAQNSWSWAMGDLRRHKEFINQLLAFLKWMNEQPKEPKTEEGAVDRSYQNKFAALACEILAMYLHSSRQVGDVTSLKDVVSSLTYLKENALALPSYNSSLQTNLKKNIERRYQGVQLANFKRTTLYPEPFGRSFFYNIELAGKLLSFDEFWKGRKAGQSYSDEVVRANLNLGLVESQVQLLQSWKVLALELSSVVTKGENVEKLVIGVVEDCMKANAQSTLPEALFGELMVVRADLSFVLLQRMVVGRVKSPEARRLLPAVWNTVRASATDFETVFSSEQVQYYRMMLRILYLALQFHLQDLSASPQDQSFRSSFRASVPATSKSTLEEPVANLLLEILSEVVAKGFRSLANQLHSDSTSVSPTDFALLTAILQTILIVPEMRNWQSQAALLFSNNNTIRYATSLFSWSDRLTTSHNGIQDPIYGELSLLFILSLSSMQVLAETMAVEGILSQLNSANLMNYFRRPGGMGPFDSPNRLHSIWTKGILPLCLNLLDSVGPPISGEISAFLNQFPEQLGRASNALNTRTATKITLSISSETHSLALIAGILDSNRDQGPRLGIQASDIPVLDWDKENVKEDIESWLARKGALRERITVMDEAEASLFERKVEGIDGVDNKLEERILRELDAAGDCLGLGRGREK
ncbi:nucleoporin subcomplex protein binding to Pom34-domain-containing protein [Clohesyomyces aquaticus]|uniref:Nucleoporin subcomplex protein binding to Pom34-domain-containing protein n=1 Tax=Clohesyomyces aquaticus TaxID=1231657 RepID=A0A1Y1ZW17_9PLEO|nr:nucleoporin subcomplex protein binding to Pom34-domain-containing protein [Clohesyomyces aquaticus]